MDTIALLKREGEQAPFGTSRVEEKLTHYRIRTGPLARLQRDSAKFPSWILFSPLYGRESSIPGGAGGLVPNCRMQEKIRESGTKEERIGGLRENPGDEKSEKRDSGPKYHLIEE